MTKKQLLLASKFLEQHSEELGNHGCNDWDFPSDWTKREKKSMVKEMCKQNGTPEEYDPDRLEVPDFWVASYLSSKLKEMAENDTRDE